jgi:two-component system sensor histidine kinase RegB
MSSGTISLSHREAPSLQADWLRLNWARAAAVVGQTLLLVVAHDSPNEPMPLLLLAACVAGAAASSMLALLHVRRQTRLDDAAFFRQILIDLAVLTYMLAISGGPANPFHDAFFIPIAVAAASLSARYAWTVAASSLVCYMFVQFVYHPLPGSPEAVASALGAGEWITHLMLAVLATYFLLRISHNLRERERQLGEERESAARAECAVAVGSIAAGAAHEMSTPLSTITAIVDELRAEHGDRADLQRSLDLLADGIGECRKALQVLRQSNGPCAPERHLVGVRELVDDVLARFQRMRPKAEVTTEIDGDAAEPTIQADLALQQAIINLLSNADAASPRYVGLRVGWDAHELRISVSDRGPGIPPEIAGQLGHSFVSTKPGGCGMGLFLTRVTAQRLGGRFRIRNAEHRGAVAEIVLPLAGLQSKRG